MLLIGKKDLYNFGMEHPQSVKPLAAWETIVTETEYLNFSHFKKTFPSADYASHCYTIFNIAGNKYRLIAKIDYVTGIVRVKQIWTHAEYSMKKNIDALREKRL